MSRPTHDSPNTAWLDEELRKEKALVTALRDTVDKQKIMLNDQAQRILALEDRLTKLQAQILRIPDVEEAQQRMRNELVQMISDQRAEQQKREAEFLKNRRLEHEQDLRAIQEIETQLKRFDALDEAIAARVVEERRLNEMTLRQQQDLEEQAKKWPPRDEVVRQLADRLDRNVVKIGQVEGALGDVAKGQQDQLARILVLGTTQSKMEQQLAELQTMRQEMTTQQDALAEDMRRFDRDRSQQLTEWGRKMEAFAHQLEQWAEQLRFFTDQHEKTRRVMREVQELSQQVSQQQDQLRQAQRIAEEQLRHEFKEWRGENDRHWVQEEERQAKAKEAQAVIEDVQDKRLADLEQFRQVDVVTVANLNSRVGAFYDEFLAESKRIRAAQLQALQMRASSMADILAEMRGLLGEKEG